MVRVDLPLTSLQAAPWVVLVLRLSALLLGLLAAVCWLWASTQPLYHVAGHSMHDLRWWSGVALASGVAVAVLTWFAGACRRLHGLLLTTALLFVLSAAVAAFVVIVPERSPIHPLSLAVPYSIAGFACAGVACLLTLGALAIPKSRGAPGAAPPSAAGLVPRVVACAISLVLLATVGGVVLDRSRDYLESANEYRRGGAFGTAPARPPASTLNGGDRWQVTVPAISLARPALTPYGIAVASGLNVIMLDPVSGGERWRYTRSDVTGSASVSRIGDGHQLLVWWGPDSVYVLDSRTGDRTGHWTLPRGRASILDPSVPVVRLESGGQTSIARLSPTGDAVWSYPLGPCERARASLVEDVLVAVVDRPCHEPAGWTVGLDPGTGRELWRSATAGDLRGAVSGAAVLLDAPIAGTARTLSAVDLDDGRLRWNRPLVGLARANTPCSDLQTVSGEQRMVVICTWDLTSYPTGPETYVSTVDSYDAVDGSLHRDTYRSGAVVAATVSGDGRLIVARADAANSMLDVVGPRPGSAHLAIGPGYTDHHGAIWTVAALDNQVIVIDSAREVLRSLR